MDEMSIGVPKVSEMETLRALLDLRARAVEMIDVARYTTMRSLSDRYYSKLNTSLAEGMRSPTLNELRRFDREMQVTIFRHLSRGQGNFEDAIMYYVENDGDALWRLLDPVVKQLPDRGVDAGAEKGGEPASVKRKAESLGQPASADAAPSKPSPTCLVCKRKHFPLCPLPPDFRQKQRAQKKAKQAEKKAAAAKSKST